MTLGKESQWIGPNLLLLGMLTLLAVGLGLGSATRLTYHEALLAQGAREILLSGNWWHPTIGGQPWLEKPPLPFWLVSCLGWCMGSVNPLVARLPSAFAALFTILGIALVASRYWGPVVGLLSGAVQATTAWTVLRGRLAEADMLLVCLLVWTLLAFDRLRTEGPAYQGDPMSRVPIKPRSCWWWVFFTLLGAMALVKGTGFGTTLALAVIAGTLLWDRDPLTARRLLTPAGWVLVLCLSLAWPLAMIAQHGPKVINLWSLHITARLDGNTGHGPFAGEPWLQYFLNILSSALPWTPFALLGAWLSYRKPPSYRHDSPAWTKAVPAEHQSKLGHHLICVWSIVPLALVSLASARRSYYTIYSLVPWSILAAIGLVHCGQYLLNRGWSAGRIRRLAWGIFTGLAAAYGLIFWVSGSLFHQRGTEWAFYEMIGQKLTRGEPLVFLYDDWDRDPYPTPFGPIPHDLAVRLYYLNQPACWHFDVHTLGNPGVETCPLKRSHNGSSPMLVIARDRDGESLSDLGRLDVMARGPTRRWDRVYTLSRIQPISSIDSRVDRDAPVTQSIRR